MRRSRSGEAFVDASELEWHECGHCDGRFARDGLELYHSYPACQRFVDALAAIGVEARPVKDVSLN